MGVLEKVARTRWVGWGNYAKFTACSNCGRQLYCRARHYGGKWLCLECHDLKG